MPAIIMRCMSVPPNKPPSNYDPSYSAYSESSRPKTGKDGHIDLSHYKPKYKIDVAQWRKFFKFKDTELTDKEVHAMADGMIDFFINFMNRLMQHALQVQKDNEKIANGETP